MRTLEIIPASPADGPFIQPFAETGRYQISACVGHSEVITYTDDLDIAQAAFETCFQKPFADNRDAHGGIYDRDERTYVVKWRGGPKAKPFVHPMIAIYQRIAASGAPLTIIGGGKRIDFNLEGERGR